MISKRLAIKGLACASQRQFQQISQAGLTGVSAVPFLLVKLSFSTDNRKAKYSTLVFWLIEEVGPQISILSCWLLILLLVAVAQTMKGWDNAYFWELVKAHPESQPPPAPVHKQRYPCNLPHLDIWEQFRFPFVGHPSSSLQVPSVRKWKVGEEGTGKKQMSIIENRVTALPITRNHLCNRASQTPCTALALSVPLTAAFHTEKANPSCAPMQSDDQCQVCRIFQEKPNTHSLNVSWDLLFWYDWFNSWSDFSSCECSFFL